MNHLISRTLRRLRAAWTTRPRLVVDGARRLGNFNAPLANYRMDYNKEQVSREHILAQPGRGLKFLDMGGKDGELTYLLGIRGDLEFDRGFYTENKRLFDEKFGYFGVDLRPAGPNVLAGDMCSNSFLQAHAGYAGFFDVIYSNNVFEHLKKPWVAAGNLSTMLKPGGLIVTIVPFAQRYHEDPEDFFRYTHTGVTSLFEDHGTYEVLDAGYDIRGRRTNWQGIGTANDIVPVDNLGAWRETWFTVNVMRKLA